MFLVRKIALAKWDAKRNIERGLEPGEIAADAVTGDLRTQRDTLSFWRCRTGSDKDIWDAALAIAAAGERLDKLDIVWLVDEELEADGQTLRVTEGRTPVAGLSEQHVDICKLDLVRLGKVAQRIVTAIKDQRWRRLTRARVKGLLVAAVQQGRINPGELAPGLQAEIGP